jgi:hypothetical protein
MAKKCFVITPIGPAESEQRAHADRIWKVVLEPVLKPAGYELVRSDKMDDPGQITDAIFRCIAESEVCVADLSFLNPNVMYELGVRHCLRLPTIQIKCEGTQNPFDAKNQRTIDFDLDSDESLVALRAEIQKQLVWIERNPGIVSNPLTNVIERSQRGFEGDQIFRELTARAPEFAQGAPATKETGDDNAESVIEVMKSATDPDLEHDGVGWIKDDDGSVSAQFLGFDIALRPQSKGRWSSSAVHSLSGYSVTYPTWRGSAELAKKAIFEAIESEAEIWGQI